MTHWLRKDRRAWRHNGLKGHVEMMIRQCTHIITTDTTTEEAKGLAVEIKQKLYELRHALNERVDP